MVDVSSTCRLPQYNRVGSLQSLFYVTDFITICEEEHLLKALKNSKAIWKEVSFSTSDDNVRADIIHAFGY